MHSLFRVLHLEYFVSSRTWPYFFYLPFEKWGVIHHRGHMYCTKTNKFYFLWKSIDTVLSVLLVIQAFCLIKEDNNEKKSFCKGKLPFCGRKLRKKCQHKILFCQCKLRKAYFVVMFNCQEKKNMNCKSCSNKFIWVIWAIIWSINLGLGPWNFCNPFWQNSKLFV